MLCSAASCLFHESILFRNCSALQHPVFSRNLFYPGTALLCSILSFSRNLFYPGTTLLCSILSFPGIYSIQELLYPGSVLCSAASCLFHESILSRNCAALQHLVFSMNLFYPGTALLCSNPVFSRNLFYTETALLCSILSFPGIYSIQELLCSAASCLFHKSILSRKCCSILSIHLSVCLAIFLFIYSSF